MDVYRQPRQQTAKSAAFWIGVLAIFTAAVASAVRAAVASDLKRSYLDPLDIAQSGKMIGVALGSAFLGFSIALLVTSLLLDRIGMKRMLVAASVALIGGSVLLMTCGNLASGRSTYHLMVAGILVCGIGWGCIEGTVNPLVASLYPSDTTRWMNMLHAWWPAGLIAGGLIGVGGARLEVDWRIIVGVVPVLALVLGLLTLRHDFPPTTSARLEIPRKAQFLELWKRPSYFVWFFLMLFTAASELAPGQWVDVALTSVVGMRGVLLLVYVSAIMFVGRHFAGPLAHMLSAERLLCASCALAFVGLYGLSLADSPLTAILAATAWGLGVCYLWPTMVSVAAERYPRAGALAIGLMGFAGAISNYFVLPFLGSIYDSAKVEAAGGADRLAAMSGEQLQPVLVHAAGESFRAVSIIPALLAIAFAALWLLRRKGRLGAAASTAG